LNSVHRTLRFHILWGWRKRIAVTSNDMPRNAEDNETQYMLLIRVPQKPQEGRASPYLSYESRRRRHGYITLRR